MTVKDTLNYIQEIYSELAKQHPHKLKDENYGIDADKPDFLFLACLCWIARNDRVQTDVWERVKKNFKERYKGDIRSIKTENDCLLLGYPKKFVP
jgi:hypothetical protein